MKWIKWGVLAALLFAAPVRSADVTINDLSARGTLAGSDLFECEVAATGSYKCTLTEIGAWVFGNPAASATPTLTWDDSDSASATNDVVATANATDTGDGTEDADFSLYQLVDGDPDAFFVADADGAGDARIVLPNESIGVDELVGASTKADGRFLQYESTGNTLQWAVGSGGAFDDSGDPVVMYTTTKDVHVGDGAGTLTGKVEIGGDADQPQLVVEGHSTQTDSVFVIQADDDTEVFTVEDDGTTYIAGSTSTITGSGTYVEIDDVLAITPVSTPPLTCGSSYYGFLYHDDSGAICICNDADTWEKLFDYTSGDTAGCS